MDGVDLAAVGGVLLPNIGAWGSWATMLGQVEPPTGSRNPAWFGTLKKPTWMPPNLVFPAGATLMHAGMGFASYMVFTDCGGFSDKFMLPGALYASHLVCNWAWAPVFFKLRYLGVACLDQVGMTVTAAATAAGFYLVNPIAGYIMLPYLGWLAFTTFVNYTLWDMNRDKKKK